MRLNRYDAEKSKVENVFPILDTLIYEMTKRAKAYSQIGDLFSFFSELKNIASDTLKKNVNHWLICIKDQNYDDLSNECILNTT